MRIYFLINPQWLYILMNVFKILRFYDFINFMNFMNFFKIFTWDSVSQYRTLR